MGSELIIKSQALTVPAIVGDHAARNADDYLHRIRSRRGVTARA
jgi:hypothetical protein